MKRTRLVLLSTVLVCCVLVHKLNVSAATLPDTNQPCSVSIEMEYRGAPINGWPITIYPVANLQASGTFDLTEGFSGLHVDFKQIASAEGNLSLANNLLLYTRIHQIAGISEITGEDGKILFEDIIPGLYLVVPDSMLEYGYDDIAPYLIMLPEKGENGTWIYNVVARPKTEAIPEISCEDLLPSVPPSTDDSSLPNPPPNTGDYSEPGILYLVFGVSLVTLLVLLFTGKKKSCGSG